MGKPEPRPNRVTPARAVSTTVDPPGFFPARVTHPPPAPEPAPDPHTRPQTPTQTRGGPRAGPPAPGAETRALLARWNSLPDLNLLARQQAGKGDSHALLSRLAKEPRRGKRACRRATIFRHQEACSTGEHPFAASDILAVGPRGDSVETSALAIHEAEAHGAALPAEVAAFLAEPTPSSSTTWREGPSPPR